MRNYTLSLIFFFITLVSYSQKKAFEIYTSKGKKVSYKKMLKALTSKEVVLFGEYHDNPISHWLELEITYDLSKSKKLILGAEMVDTDNQLILNNYLSDSITYKELDSLARLWPNHKTDYAPLVEFAKKEQLDFIATNIPRRYANLVYRKGFSALDTLNANEKEWIAPLPISFDSELKTYQNILTMMGDHGSPKLVMAQATKDATMAHFILKNYKENHLFLHFNGAYHSDYQEGIVWYLKREKTEIKHATISTVSQENIDTLSEENIGKANFIICIDNDMTSTY